MTAETDAFVGNEGEDGDRDLGEGNVKKKKST